MSAVAAARVSLPSVTAPENALLAAVFVAAVLLPVTEIVLRAVLGIGVPNVNALVQHLTLAVGMLGGAVAAREKRLLTLAVSGFIPGRAAHAARIVAGAVGMVEMALAELQKNGVVQLDEERKAQMVSNLLVVLCGERSTQPIVNAGSLY